MATKNRVETRGEKHYLYEITPYWDAAKKQGRVRKAYIGPCDADGNLQEGRRRGSEPVAKVLSAATYGPYDLLRRLAEDMGLGRRLRESFGDDVGGRILTLAILRVTDPDSMRAVRDTLDAAYLETPLGTRWSYSSQRLSELLEGIGREPSKRRAFYESCMQDDDVAVFDTSVLHSSSKGMDMLESGRGTRRTGLPQVNLGLVHSLRTCLPVMMKLFPGSVSDSTTVRGLILQLRDMGSKRIVMVMDRGFYSEGNMRFLAGMEGVDYLMPVKSSTELCRTWTSIAKRDLESSVNMFSFHGRTESFSDFEVNWPYEPAERGGRPVEKVRVLVFHNTEGVVDETNTFISRVEAAERLAAETVWRSEARAVSDVFRGGLEGMEPLFEISASGEGTVRLERRRNAMTYAMRNFGRIVLVTSLDWAPGEILELYRRRDEDEKEYESLKDGMDGGISYVHGVDSAKGALFVQFAALSLRMYMSTRMNGDMRALDIPLILRRLRSMTVMRLSTGWMVNEVPKKCRDIYKAFGYEPPESNSLLP